MKRNSLVVSVVLTLLAVFAWSGWANYQYRKQDAERRLAASTEVALVPANGKAAAGDPSKPLLGQVAPAFTLEDLNGHKVSLSDFKGKVLLLNFWATWCGPCKQETPWLIELRNRYAAQGVEVIGISADQIDLNDATRLSEEKQEIAHFVQKLQIPYPVLINGDSLSRYSHGPYGDLDALPTSFFVNRKGVVAAVQLGVISEEDIEANLKTAMASQ